MNTLRTITVGASVAALIASSFLVVPALATPSSGFAGSPIVNGHFGTLNENTAGDKTGKWGLILKTLDDTDVGSDRLTIQPGGFSGWHVHPGPVFVTVTRGSVIWHDGSDPLCTAHTFNVGDSYIESAYGPHNVQNASNSEEAEFIAIIIRPEGFTGPAFRLDRPQPNNCTF
jgi:quercetin dioxygenase-like cupin family protein